MPAGLVGDDLADVLPTPANVSEKIVEKRSCQPGRLAKDRRTVHAEGVHGRSGRRVIRVMECSSTQQLGMGRAAAKGDESAEVESGRFARVRGGQNRGCGGISEQYGAFPLRRIQRTGCDFTAEDQD